MDPLRPKSAASPVSPSNQGSSSLESPQTSHSTAWQPSGGAVSNESTERTTFESAKPPPARPLLDKAIGLHQAFEVGDSAKALDLLRGGTAESNARLMFAYLNHFGRDLEYDLRGYALDLKKPLDAQGFSLTLRGLKGAPLDEAFRLLHGPRLEANAARIAQLTASNPAATPEGRKEIYGLLARAGGEERTLLAELFLHQTGRDLVGALRPVTEASASTPPPPPSDPEKTVAIVVSSGNWKQVLSGQTDRHVGGYHWREIEAYVKEALDRGYTPVIFTPDGLPPSPDATSLMQGKLGPKVGFGHSAHNGPDSAHGRVILEAFTAPRSLKDFDASKYATVHIAGGHGAHQDLIGNPLVERAVTQMHERGRVVTAVCHATPALGALLAGGPATGYSPQLDAFNVKAGFVLPEFIPPYDAHRGLRELGAKLNALDTVQAIVNVNHTEVFNRNGVPVVTGTGPEATDDVARYALDWLAKRER